jgi:riboflavin kinase / FMN adenylyltransferase
MVIMLLASVVMVVVLAVMPLDWLMNIVPESAEKLVPGNGVYATRVSVEGGEWMPAMLNIGTNPTFQRQQTTIEAHIIGFEGDIYGRKVRVEFGRKLRDEQRFESVEALQKQLEADKKEVEVVRW